MGTLDLKITDSLAKVFPDEEPAGAESLRISALKGETVSAVVAYWGNPDERKNWKVTVDAPEGIRTRLRLVELVPSSYPCHAHQDDNYLRTAPGLFPDLLRDPDMADGAYAIQDVPGQWRSLWLDAAAETEFCGDAEIAVRFYRENGTETQEKQVTLCLHVADAELPEQKLLHTEWFHADCLADYYHVEAFSEEHWQILENFIRCYASRGINTILTPVVTPALDTEVGGERTTVQLVKIVKEGGHYSFDFADLKRWIALCEKYGITHFEMAHLFTQWGAKHAPKVMPAHGFNHRIDSFPSRKSRAQADSNRCHTALRAEIALGKDGIHNCRRMDFREAGQGFIHKKRHFTPRMTVRDLLCRFHAAADHALHFSDAVIHRLAERRAAPDGGRLRTFDCKHAKTAAMQMQNRAGCKIARTAHQNEIFHGRITFPAPLSFSAMTYILVTSPTASRSVRP